LKGERRQIQEKRCEVKRKEPYTNEI